MRILNLGAGQQSTAVFLLAATGEIPKLDYAIFADTGEEPVWVYEQVKALSEFPDGCPILIRALLDDAGHVVRLGDSLIGENDKQYASTIPAFIKHGSLFEKGKPAKGMGKRQCTNNFKISVIESTIRYELLGLKPGQVYRGERITQLFGLDFDEGERIFRLKGRLAANRLAVGEFPLWDMQWRRSDCVAYLAEVWGREVFPSACTFCPLVNNSFRRLIRDRDPVGHARACDVDERMRLLTSRSQQGLNSEVYIHKQMIPLSQVNLDEPDGLFSFAQDCGGFCGH